ncbi:MAG: hypothetical protein K0R78_3051, partial [Pelosinus sp.]|nr:hypothetical protein [Pelosinus sp.]
MAGIYGLSGSGIDVDQLVKDGMKAQQIRRDTLQQKETQLEWKKTDFNTMYTAVNDFRNSTVWNYTLQNTTQPKKTTSSNDTVATITASAAAANVNHSLIVSQLAAGVTKTSTGSISTGVLKDSLAQQFLLTPPADTATFDVKINGKTITVDPTKSINDFVSQINSSKSGVKANYDATLDRFFIYANDTGSASKVDFAGSSAAGLNFITGNLKIDNIATGNLSRIESTDSLGTGFDPNAKLTTAFGLPSTPFKMQISNGASAYTITFNPTTDSLKDVIDTLNDSALSSLHLSASYDAVTKKFSLQATEGTLSFAGSDAASLSFLTDNLKVIQTGKDAEFVLDGTNFTQPKNDFTISGVSYSLKSTGSTTAGVTPDIDATVASVKKFVEDYNAVLKKINDKLNEKYYKDYLPLTSTQKESMKESEITAWEAKAKSGLLYHNTILRSAVNQMRNNISSPVAGVSDVYTSLASIGITTSSWEEEGLLHIDEGKLRKALEGDPVKGIPADPDIVNKLFTAKGNSEDKNNTYSQSGVVTRLYDTLKVVTENIKTEAGITASPTGETKSNLAKQIKEYKDRMSDMDRNLKNLRERLYAQYSAMET